MNIKKGDKRHSYIKLSGNKSQCVTCGLIRHLITNGVEYYYPEMGNIRYFKTPDCKK
jgi:hypothetical protein